MNVAAGECRGERSARGHDVQRGPFVSYMTIIIIAYISMTTVI